MVFYFLSFCFYFLFLGVLDCFLPLPPNMRRNKGERIGGAFQTIIFIGLHPFLMYRGNCCCVSLTVYAMECKKV